MLCFRRCSLRSEGDGDGNDDNDENDDNDTQPIDIKQPIVFNRMRGLT